MCFYPSPSSSLTHVCLANDEEEEEERKGEREQEERHMPLSSPQNIRHVREGEGLRALPAVWVAGWLDEAQATVYVAERFTLKSGP